MRAYGRRCAFSKCDVREVLEAALIRPYRGAQTYHVSNGLLLRSDLHTLFDLGQLSVDTSSMTVVISKKLEDTSYRFLKGRPILIPQRHELRPSVEALDSHRMTWGL
jgi:predicted restriction endonuclease